MLCWKGFEWRAHFRLIRPLRSAKYIYLDFLLMSDDGTTILCFIITAEMRAFHKKFQTQTSFKY